jgi:hypothetical protein
VIVLVRPRTALPPDDVARLWKEIANGSNLLLALDPPGHNLGYPDSADSGLAKLLTTDFGLILQNGFLIEPWFTAQSIQDVTTSYSQVRAGPLPNAISDPLVSYDLPVEVWGARHIRVEPFGPDSRAFPLLYTEPEFAETNSQIFSATNTAPIELNLGTDYIGRLTVAAIGENTKLNSRVALLADGEILENDFGLAHRFNSVAPVHMGDWLLAQRLGAWLLETPEEDWPTLPSGYTWLAVDGDPADWDTSLPSLADATGDTSVLSFDIQQARAFRNDSYLYVLVEMASAANPQSQLTFKFDRDGDGTAETTLVGHDDGTVTLDDGTPVPDGTTAVGAALEIRLPLRLTGQGAVANLCLNSERQLAFPLTPDCLDQPLPVTSVNQDDPAPDRFYSGLSITIQTTDRANVRTGPGTDFASTGSFRNGEVLAAVGRNDAVDWIQVENGTLIGWVASFLLIANGDLQSLPVVQ